MQEKGILERNGVSWWDKHDHNNGNNNYRNIWRKSSCLIGDKHNFAARYWQTESEVNELNDILMNLRRKSRWFVSKILATFHSSKQEIESQKLIHNEIETELSKKYEAHGF